MIVLTPDQMQKMDETTIEDGYPALLLMETAGREVAALAHNKINQKRENNNDLNQRDFNSELRNSKFDQPQITVFCGKGNNGGDGLVAARFLDMWDYQVNIILMGSAEGLSGINRKNYTTCILRDINIYEWKNLNQEDVIQFLKKSDAIIDAMLGTGLKGEVRGKIAEAIDYIQGFKADKCQVIAVDIPTGISGNSGKVLGKAVAADYTATMAFKKVGLCVYPGREYVGEIKVVDIGMPDTVTQKVPHNHYQLNQKEVSKILPDRNKTGHKGTFGKVGVIGGCRGMSGAPYLSGYSALKMGAGLVKVAVPESIQATVAAYTPELITCGLTDNNQGIIKQALPQIFKFIKKVDVVAVGPGLGQFEDTQKIVYNILKDCSIPVVIDADGINVINDLNVLSKREAPLVLTPHPGEMSRLINTSIKKIQADRIEVARNFAKKYQINLVLKGAATIVADPTGKVFINPTGNEGMATAGSGDVLTGIISGLLSQGLEVGKAASVGSYLHGLAGDIGCNKFNSHSITAEDIMNYLPEAVNAVR